MKNKKGFTLIELLGVIIILTLIISLVIPKILGTTKSKNVVINALKDDVVYKAAKLYLDDIVTNPEDNNKYCVAINDLVEKEYFVEDDNYKNKYVTAIYKNGYSYFISDTCIPTSSTYDRCESEGICSACYVSKTYNNGVYLYEPKIVTLDESQVGESLGIIFVKDDDACTLSAIYQAADDYVQKKVKERSYKKKNGNRYCIPLGTLVDNGYLKRPIKYQNNDDITDLKTVQATYSNSNFNYDLVNQNSCTQIDNFTPIVELYDGLTPIVYDEQNLLWKIADLSNLSEDEYFYDDEKHAYIVDNEGGNYYSYNNQIWANAAILTANGKTKQPGSLLNLDTDVYAMFVWIPRYSYTIKNTYGKKLDVSTYGAAYDPSSNYPGAIDIKFINANTKNTGSASYVDNINNSWFTPPAFKFGKTELQGYWFGKFESNYLNQTTGQTKDKLTSCDEQNQAINCTVADNVRILPNLISMCSGRLKQYYYVARSMVRTGNVFGLDKSIVDTHGVKNSEWAGVLYLTNSQYGKYGNNSYTYSNKYVYSNNSRGNANQSKTGVSSGQIKTSYVSSSHSVDGTYSYSYKGSNQSNGVGASTTGNIYGIYDMNGGNNDIMMASFDNVDDYFLTYDPNNNASDYEPKYYELFDNNTHSFRKTGNATIEFSDWMGVTLSTGKKIVRGGDSYIYANNGFFNVLGNVADGGAGYQITLRVILTQSDNIG